MNAGCFVKILSVLLAVLFVFGGCNTAGSGDESEVSKPVENEYEGSLKLVTSEDGKTVTISYKVDGEEVSYTVPNNANYLSGGFGATDDLGRTLENSGTVGIYGENGEHYVGLFYFLWHGEHGDNGAYDLQKIMDTYGELAKNANAVDPETGERLYGNVGDMHWFAEPLYGYYYAKDEWVVRKHMELLSNANIDFLYFDVTNGFIYKENALNVMRICHELNEQGYDAPQVVFYTNSNSAGVMKQLYDEIYSQNLYPDTWFYVDGKPCIVGVYEGNVDDFFTVKLAQWPNESVKKNSWPWMDFKWPQRVFKDGEGKKSAISVSIAQHNESITFSDSSLYGYALNRGRSFGFKNAVAKNMQKYREQYDADNSLTLQGINFQAQWDKAISADVPYVLVTGWNEWVAQRQNGAALRNDEDLVYFVDTASMEFSRDAEMMRGGYFDNYYIQLIYNVQRLKGAAPVIVQDARNAIDVTGSFDQWKKVAVTYTDPKGDTADRNAMGFGQTTYTDNSGNNDIIEAKVTHDTKKHYFYVKTAAPVTKYSEDQAWMQLFVNTDKDGKNGWNGYDYLINSVPESDTVTAVAACGTEDGALTLKETGKVSYKVDGNEMMICVPLETLGIDSFEEIYLEFKWADAKGVKYTRMEDFYLYGDVSPLGRLNHIYQNYIPKTEE